MISFDAHLSAEPLETARLTLEPLRVEHAEELAPLLDDERLHEFIGGRPANLSELQARFTRQVVGRSDDGVEGWLNWVARLRQTSQAVGTLQATVHRGETDARADVAWVIAGPHQRLGYAQEAAIAMVDWLRRHGVTVIEAFIHPRHTASMGVARGLGMQPTEELVDDEVRWTRSL